MGYRHHLILFLRKKPPEGVGLVTVGSSAFTGWAFFGIAGAGAF